MIKLNKSPHFASEYSGKDYKNCENCGYRDKSYCLKYEDDIQEEYLTFKYPLSAGCFYWKNLKYSKEDNNDKS
jgi:hypothetical protein